MKYSMIVRCAILIGTAFAFASIFQNCSPQQRLPSGESSATSKVTGEPDDIVHTMPVDIPSRGSYAESPTALISNYEIYVDGLLYLSSDEISFDEAYSNCHDNAVSNSDSLVLCLYNNKEIFANVGQKLYRGFHDQSVFASAKNTSYSAAVENCLQNANENMKQNTRCMWGEDEIYFQAAGN